MQTAGTLTSSARAIASVEAAAEALSALADLVDPTAAGQSAANAPTPSFAIDLSQSSDGLDDLAGLTDRQLQAVQRQVNGLQSEINDLRRRDETLNFYMQRLDEELRLAARLQQDFLPKELPQIGPVHFHSLFRPAGYVSGDLYDVMRLDEKHIGFYMADAVGHGVPAALLTMFLKHALQTKETGVAVGGGKKYRLLDPGESLRRLNNALLEQNLSNTTFATALYGMINVETLEVQMARAGHPGAIILRAGSDGAIETLEPDGSLLGIFPDEEFATCTAQLHPGDRLVIYTDGVEVAFWEDQTADTNRWKDELFTRRHLNAEEMLTAFADSIDAEAGSLSAKDDLTMMMIDVVAVDPAIAPSPR